MAERYENTSPFADAPIFYYGGHGSDLCEPGTGRPYLDKVPENCIYITITECGMRTDLTFIPEKTEENLFRDPSMTYILRHPEVYMHKRIIANALHVDADAVHVHLPGQTYVRSYLSPFSFWHDPKRSAIAISGLIEKKKLEELDRQADPLKPFEIKKKIRIRDGMKGNRLLTLLSRFYKGDVETLEYANQCMDVIVENMKVKLGKPALTRKTFYFRPKESNWVVSQVNFSIPKEKFVGFFSASIYPTAGVIASYLDDKYPRQTKIFGGQLPEIANGLEQLLESASTNRTSQLTNAHLMKTYPGIHYNVVCREVSPSCIVSLQRSASYNQEIERLHGRSYRYTLNNNSFQSIMQNVSNTTNRRFPYFATKKRAVRNYLLSRAENLVNSSNEQKKNLLNFLTRKKIITNNNAQPISKTIKYIVDPKKYAAYVSGGTRKRRR